MSGALARLLDGALTEALPPVVAAGGEAFTPAQLLAHAATVAEALSGRGLRADEPVLVVTANRPLDLATLLGIWRAGGVAVPLHVGAAPATIAAVVQQTGARFRVDLAAVQELASAPPPARPLLAGAALVIFTSGSTGRPKGVVIGHDRLAAKLDVLDRMLALTPADTVVVPLQLIFIFGIWACLLALRSRARLILVGKFSAATVAPLWPQTTVFVGVPSMLRVLFADDTRVPGLRAVVTGGEALGTVLSERLQRALPQAGIYDLYGLTETGSCDFCLDPAHSLSGVGSIGRPTEQVDFAIVAADGNAVAAGVAGELLIRTPFGMLGYLDNPALTRDSFSDGRFRTGDLARLRADGLVEIVGRIKDLISRGGNKIAPAEIDLLLLSHPLVRAALCAGVADAKLGEVIHAAVVLQDGAELSAADLRAWLAQRIERFKLPDVIHFVTELPVGPTGKAMRAGVAALAATA